MPQKNSKQVKLMMKDLNIEFSAANRMYRLRMKNANDIEIVMHTMFLRDAGSTHTMKIVIIL